MKPEPTQPGTSSVASVVITYLLVAGCGIWALPALLAPSARQTAPSSPLPVAAVLWILGAALLVILGIAVAPAFDRVVRSAVRRTPWFRTDGPHAVPAATTGWISLPVVATVNVALAETTIRPAIVAALGGPVYALTTDALIAVGCLIVFLLLLLRLQLIARPWVEAGAWYTLDALMATSNSEGARRFYDTGQHRTRAIITERGDRAGDEVTRQAPSEAATVFGGEATMVATAPDTTATISAVQSSADQTVLAERLTERGDR